MPSRRPHHEAPAYQSFQYQGVMASYAVDRDGWIQVTFNGATSQPHELKGTPAHLMAQIILSQMREFIGRDGSGQPG